MMTAVKGSVKTVVHSHASSHVLTMLVFSMFTIICYHVTKLFSKVGPGTELCTFKVAYQVQITGVDLYSIFLLLVLVNLLSDC